MIGYLKTDTKIEDYKPSIIKEMSIEFSDTNRFYAVSSCNYFSGYYSVHSTDSITIDGLVTTYKYCIDDIVRYWEEKYFDGLKNANKYIIEGSRLTIKTTSNIDLFFKGD